MLKTETLKKKKAHKPVLEGNARSLREQGYGE